MEDFKKISDLYYSEKSTNKIKKLKTRILIEEINILIEYNLNFIKDLSNLKDDYSIYRKKFLMCKNANLKMDRHLLMEALEERIELSKKINNLHEISKLQTDKFLIQLEDIKKSEAIIESIGMLLDGKYQKLF